MRSKTGNIVASDIGRRVFLVIGAVAIGLSLAAIWIPPGRKHWHGAAPNTAMTHIAIQEHLDGKVVE